MSRLWPERGLHERPFLLSSSAFIDCDSADHGRMDAAHVRVNAGGVEGVYERACGLQLTAESVSHHVVNCAVVVPDPGEGLVDFNSDVGRFIHEVAHVYGGPGRGGGVGFAGTGASSQGQK